MDIDIEILPYAEAPWAPKSHGCNFTWAWRIRKDSVNNVTGTCSGPRRYAMQMARRAAARMKHIVVGEGKPREFVISPWIRRNSAHEGFR